MTGAKENLPRTASEARVAVSVRVPRTTFESGLMAQGGESCAILGGIATRAEGRKARWKKGVLRGEK